MFCWQLLLLKSKTGGDQRFENHRHKCVISKWKTKKRHLQLMLSDLTVKCSVYLTHIKEISWMKLPFVRATKQGISYSIQLKKVAINILKQNSLSKMISTPLSRKSMTKFAQFKLILNIINLLKSQEAILQLIKHAKTNQKCMYVMVFWNTLRGVAHRGINHNVWISLGDFNAQTGSSWYQYPGDMGEYGKRQTIGNDQVLPELCKKHDIKLTSTTFRQSSCHISTRTAPNQDFRTDDGSLIEYRV